MIHQKVFVVFRKSPGEEKPIYNRYSVPVKPGMTVLEALFYIQDHCDSSLAFRYACRGAICGSCGMTINKIPQLACSTQVMSVNQNVQTQIPRLTFGEDSDWDKKKEILIEPLPNMKIVKDLVVDMNPFWAFYKKVKPFFEKNRKNMNRENLQSSETVKDFEHLIYCILCGLCWTCPVYGKNKKYMGPAALAKGYRFVADSRMPEMDRKQILRVVKQKEGVPSCEKIFVCNQVCPKGVKPGTAIHSIRTYKKSSI